jgi:hypothetical protein
MTFSSSILTPYAFLNNPPGRRFPFLPKFESIRKYFRRAEQGFWSPLDRGVDSGAEEDVTESLNTRSEIYFSLASLNIWFDAIVFKERFRETLKNLEALSPDVEFLPVSRNLGILEMFLFICLSWEICLYLLRTI